MDGVVRYLTHPQVMIDAEIAIDQWALNDIGVSRVNSLVKLKALSGTTRVISSAEKKAIETAWPLAQSLGIEPEIRPLMHENDRSSTGFLPPDAFEKVADQFFANPDCSVRGWETAADAQRRIVSEVNAVLDSEVEGDVLIVGHGGVGTLLFCALASVPINRLYDQGPGGGGCFFAFSRTDRKPHTRWQPMEQM